MRLVILCLMLSGCVSVDTPDWQYSRFSPWGGQQPVIIKQDEEGKWQLREEAPADPNNGLLELLLRQRGLVPAP